MQGDNPWVNPTSSKPCEARKKRPRRESWPIVLGAALCALSGCSGGPDTSALPPGVRPVGSSAVEEGKPLTLDAVGGFLGAGYLFTREVNTGSAVKRTESQVEERAGLGASGSIYSPNFVLYELAGVVGPSQAWANDGTSSTFDTGILYEGEANARFFPKRWHPANLYFSRIQDFEPRLFLSKLESTTTTARGTQDFLMRDGNLRFEASHRELEQTVFGVAEQAPFLDVTEDTVGASGDYRLTDRQTINGSYTFQNVEQAVTENSFSAHNVLGNHTLFLGDLKDHQLRSRAEGLFQEGSLDQQLVRVDETFDAKISGDLQGDMGFHFERNDTNILDLEIVRGDAGLRHELFESLSSSLRVQGGQQTTDGQSTTNTVGGLGSLNYRKKTPVGVLRMTYSTFLERRFVTNDQGGAIDERHTFPAVPPEELRLTQARVDPASIVITDPTGLLFYREGLDYTVTQDSSGLTTITRVFTGNIPQGGDVLVDYVFRNGTDFTLDTMTQAFRLEHELHGGLTPYFAFNHQDQNVFDVEGPGGIVPVRERAFIGGLEWRRPTFLLGGEYETRESTVLPFDAIRLKAQGNFQIGDYQQLVANATQTWLSYSEPDRDVSVSQGTLRWRSSLGKNTTFYLDAAIRYEDDSLQGSSFGYGAGGGIEYLWRKFSFRLRAAHRQTRGTSSDFEGDEVGIWIVREFGNPPPSTSNATDRFLRQ